MKTIEERAKEVYPAHEYSVLERVIKRGAYIRGAKDQKAIEEEVTLKKYDAMTEKQLDREERFTSWYFQNVKGVPTFSDAIEWARQELIDEACEIVRNIANEYFGDWEQSCKVEDTFRKAMEE